jgi:molybdopterin-dependent oxidoreductase alpha subunit
MRRDMWVGFKPNGIGETKPNHYGEMVHTAWENKRHLPYAFRILSKGVCDGCALGVAGFHDWTLSGVHLCTTRLNLLQVNTMGALDPARLADVSTLPTNARELRELGRLPFPMMRRRGEPGFTRVTWDDALEIMAARIRDTAPDRLALYLTARGLTNESYYAAQKAMRFFGTNNIDNAARVCHSPSTVALKRAIGAAATTCSYTDVIGSDLIVLIGGNMANAQPVFMKYLYLAKTRGAKVVVVNPYREPGLERYWVPSNAQSAVFGTKVADDFFAVAPGGDAAFFSAVLKTLVERDALDDAFIAAHTQEFDKTLAALSGFTIEDLAERAGLTVDDVDRFTDLYAGAANAVLVWSMGITQHATGTDQVGAIVNLALARGNVGRENTGLMPIRGHSGVQGGAEMGAYATAFPGGVAIDAENAAALAEQWGFAIPDLPGLTAAEMVERAHTVDIDLLWTSGGNFLEVLPDAAFTRQALERVALRVHQDIFVSSQMLVDPAETVLLLPTTTRYEQRDGGTETTTERRIVFSPEIRGPRIGEARSEWQIYGDVAAAVDPERAHLVTFENGQALREEIARVVPLYVGIETLAKTGDAVQWGGARLGEDGEFATADGHAHFVPITPYDARVPEGRFRLSTRRGKQFNTMVWRDRDPLTGATRDAVFLSATDLERLAIADGAHVMVRSEHGELRGRVFAADIRPAHAQVFFPEGNVLLAIAVRDQASGVPEDHVLVDVVPL